MSPRTAQYRRAESGSLGASFPAQALASATAALTVLTILAGCQPSQTAATQTKSAPTATALPPTATPPPLAATVDGEYITLSEFEVELAQFQASRVALGQTLPDDEARRLVLDDLIAQVLLAQAARAAGFVASDEKLAEREAALEQSLGEPFAGWKQSHGYSDEGFRRALKRAVEAAWMRDSIIAAVPTRAEHVHVRQILAYNEADGNRVLERLAAGEDFDALAAASDPVTRGELGWVPPDYLLDVAADDAVFALEVGQYSELIETVAGFHVFKAVERAVRSLSPDALLAAQSRALESWLVGQRDQSEIVRMVS